MRMAFRPPDQSPDVFLSHSGEQKGFARDLYAKLSPTYSVFFDVTRDSLPLGESFPQLIFKAAETCKVALVVLSDKFFRSKWPMLELCKFFEASRVQIVPLFYKLTPGDLSQREKVEVWRKSWQKFESEDGRIKVSSCSDACRKLSHIKGLVFEEWKGHTAYLDEIELEISEKIPRLSHSLPDVVHGKERLCQVFIDKFEELEQTWPLNTSIDLPRVFVLGVYGVPGSGKSTICACLHERLFLSFNRRAVHLNLPSDRNPTKLTKSFGNLLQQTNFGKRRGDMMMSEIEDITAMVKVLKDSNLGRLRVFLVIDNITKYSMEWVEAILRVGVGAGSRVVLVAQTLRILRPLLEMLTKTDNHVSYVWDQMRVPSMNTEEAISMVLQYACHEEMAEEQTFNHNREFVGLLIYVCAMLDEFPSPDGVKSLVYLPPFLKLFGIQLRRNKVDLKACALFGLRFWMWKRLRGRGSKFYMRN